MRPPLPLLATLSLVMLATAIVPIAIAQEVVTLPGPPGADPLGTIASASPPVAVALALAWGAYQLGQVVTRAGALVDRVLERGIPVRLELSEKDRALIEEHLPVRAARRAGG